VSPFLVAMTDIAAAAPVALPSLWRTGLAVTVVLGLIGTLAWLMKRGVLRQRERGGMRLETALPLGDRRSLVIVTVEGRRLLLGLSPAQVSLVTELQQTPTFDQAMTHATTAAGERS
jgi:flagellar protein FliO/FliZ